jgi:energy-converting hydrogenase Eha subunit A
MKQDKIMPMIIAGFIGVFLAIIVSKVVFLIVGTGNFQIDTVPIISTQFPLPNKQYFNNKSIDPTPLINIGPNNNSNLFSSSSNN